MFISLCFRVLLYFHGFYAGGFIGPSNRGRRNAISAKSTQGARRAAKKRFENYLMLSGVSWDDWNAADPIKQSNLLGGYVKCLRKQGSYKTNADRVCFLKKIFFVLFFWTR